MNPWTDRTPLPLSSPRSKTIPRRDLGSVFVNGITSETCPINLEPRRTTTLPAETRSWITVTVTSSPILAFFVFTSLLIRATRVRLEAEIDGEAGCGTGEIWPIAYAVLKHAMEASRQTLIIDPLGISRIIAPSGHHGAKLFFTKTSHQADRLMHKCMFGKCLSELEVKKRSSPQEESCS